jgi:hypothetical protein
MSDGQQLLERLRVHQDNRRQAELSRRKAATLIAVDQLWRVTGQIMAELQRTGYPETLGWGIDYQPLTIAGAETRAWRLKSNDKNVTASGVDYINDFGSLSSYWTDPAAKGEGQKLVFFVDEVHALLDHDMVGQASTRVQQVRVGLDYLLASLKEWPDESDKY